MEFKITTKSHQEGLNHITKYYQKKYNKLIINTIKSKKTLLKKILI